MATYFARKAGNINATDVWATTPSGTAAAVTFASGDVLVANSFAITINVDTNLGGAGQVRNDTTGGATAGGGFTLNAGITLTANCFAGSSATACVTFSSTAPSVGYVVGNVTGGTGASNSIGTLNSSTGSLYLTGSVTGGSGNASSFGCQASGGGNVYITGNVTGGSLGEGARAANGGNVYITGNVIGGQGSAYGARNLGTGSIVVTGQAIASATTSAILNSSTGTVSVTRAVGNGYGVGSIGQSLVAAVDSSVQGSITIVQELEWGALGAPPTNGVIRLSPASTNLAKFYTGTGTKTLVDATQGQMPAANNVRSGVSYASGALTGTCAVPAAGSVALGVPVDNTAGTAVLTPEAVWSAATRTITGGTVDTLTNAPASVTPSDIWSHATRTITGGSVDTLVNAPSVPSASAIASQVRTELSVELSRIDAATSTRATPANIPTADITAIKAKTDLLNTTRLGQVATTEIVGNLLAQANS